MSTPTGTKRISDFFAPAQSAKKARVDDASPRSSATAASSSAGTSIPAASSSTFSTKLLSTTAPLTDIAGSAATTFDLDAFRESLSADSVDGKPSERDLLALECECLHASWLALLQKEVRMSYFLTLKRFLWQEGLRWPIDAPQPAKSKVFPPAPDVYSWSRHTPLDKVKVVIIGQDPYHNDGQAHGLSFSVRPGVAVPPSLRNMYKEIKNEYPTFTPPKHGHLVPWAEQGVLLLNTSLTVRAHEAGSHSNKGWEQFTDKVLGLVDRYANSNGVGQVGKGVVFLAWGAWAGKRVAKLSKTKHLILTSAHPSPLSASCGFIGNGHFKKANEWLEQKFGAEATIDWTKLD